LASADFGGEAVIGALDLAEPATAEKQPALRQVGPVHEEDVDLRPVEQPGGEVLRCERVVVEESLHIEIVDREVRARLDRARQEPGRRDIGEPVDQEVAVMIGEAAHPAVEAFKPPASRKGSVEWYVIAQGKKG
jgi:hypothetical protein